jgi:Trk-type K+ transport system membrane component
VNRVGRFQLWLERRWLLLPLAVAIGLISLLLFSTTVQRDYWEYLIYPKEKAADNYIYPQLRYTVFDVALLLWCLDGFVACGLSLRSALSKRSVSGWTYRTIVIYFVLFTVLILGGILMMVARHHGL